MQLEADTVDRTGVKRCERAGVERCDVGRMMGACVRGLELRHVREVSKVARRCKGCNEFRQFIAIACEHRRARRAFQHESACHRAEKFLAYDFLDNREAASEHVHQARDHVVAVHGQASRGSDRAGRTDSDRDRLLSVEQSFGKGSFYQREHDPSYAAEAREASAIMRSAAVASARSIDQSGMSLSHSMTVAIGPMRAMTPA